VTDRVGTEELRDLSARARAGDVAARNRIVEAYLPLVVSIARRFLDRGMDLADMVQEGAIGVMDAIEADDSREGGSLNALIYLRARSRIQDAIPGHRGPVRLTRYGVRKGRGAAVPVALELAAESLFDESPGPPEIAEWRELLAMLPRALAGLSERKRAAVSRKFGLDGRGGASMAELGREFGQPRTTVLFHVDSGVKMLATALGA